MKKIKFSRKLLLPVTLILIALALIPLFNRKKDHSAPSSPTSDAVVKNSDTTTPLKHRRSDREADRQLAAEGATTDATLATFPAKAYQHLQPPSGKAAGAPAGEAYIHVPSAGRRIAMEANQIGEFPTVETKPKDTVGVRLLLDGIKPGTPVRVAIMDGGSFPMKSGLAQVIPAADWRGVAFEFTTSINIGFHRVLVEAQGHPARILNFSAHDATWPPPSQAAAN